MGEEASPSPSEGGDVSPKSTSFYQKEASPLTHLQPPQAPPKEGMCSPKVLLSIKKKPLPPTPTTASPPL